LLQDDAVNFADEDVDEGAGEEGDLFNIPRARHTNDNYRVL